MQTYEKLNAIASLAALGVAIPGIDLDILNLVDKLASPSCGTNKAPQPLSPTLDEMCLARSRGKLPAIKAYRTRTGEALREAKEAIEKAMGHVGWEFHNINGHHGSGRPTHLFEDIEPVPF